MTKEQLLARSKKSNVLPRVLAIDSQTAAESRGKELFSGSDKAVFNSVVEERQGFVEIRPKTWRGLLGMEQ